MSRPVMDQPPHPRLPPPQEATAVTSYRMTSGPEATVMKEGRKEGRNKEKKRKVDVFQRSEGSKKAQRNGVPEWACRAAS